MTRKDNGQTMTRKKKKDKKSLESEAIIPVVDYSQLDIHELRKLMTSKMIMSCHYYIRDWNMTEACIKAGYSGRSAGAIAAENLQKPIIKEYISRISKDLEKEAQISKLQMIEELKAVALAQIPDLFDDWITRKELSEIRQNHPHLSKAIKEVSTKTKQELNALKEPVEVEYVKVVFHDKLKAIESIFKAMGWNEAEKINHTFEQPLFPDVD